MLLGNFSRKFGACRAYQIGHGAIATGMLLMAIPSKALLIAGSIVIGMGHGMLVAVIDVAAHAICAREEPQPPVLPAADRRALRRYPRRADRARDRGDRGMALGAGR